MGPIVIDCYWPPTELRESNVFSRHVHHSAHRIAHDTITRDALDLNVQGPPQPWPPPRTSDLVPPQPWPNPKTSELEPPALAPPLPVTSSGDHDHWRPVQTCSFGDPPKEWHLVVTETEARTVSKRAVRFLLEWCLVNRCDHRFIDSCCEPWSLWLVLIATSVYGSATLTLSAHTERSEDADLCALRRVYVKYVYLFAHCILWPKKYTGM